MSMITFPIVDELNHLAAAILLLAGCAYGTYAREKAKRDQS